MFSFWSNEEDDHSDDETQEKAKNVGNLSKPGRFQYTANEKRDEWSTSPLPSRSISPANNNRIQGRLTNNASEDRSKRMDDILKDAWSVRKNVKVNTTNTSKASDIGPKSFYSRHGQTGGTSQIDTNDKLVSGVPNKSWNHVSRTSYSYSDQQIDVLDNDNNIDNNNDKKSPYNSTSTGYHHQDEVQRQNIVNSIKHGMMSGPIREQSARTKRAQKFNNAYLRSTGLGQFAPKIPKRNDDTPNMNNQHPGTSTIAVNRDHYQHFTSETLNHPDVASELFRLE